MNRKLIYPVLRLLFYMMQVDLYMKFIPEMTGQGIRRIHAPVLTTRAAKIYSKAFKTSFDIIFHGDIHDIVNAVQVLRHPRLLFQEILYLFIPPGQRLELGDPSGIQDPPAIE